MSCSHPILKDPVVFTLLVAISMFRDPVNIETNLISDQYWTMLTRWLARMGQDYGRIDPVQAILPVLARCINTLPIMMEMQHQLV